MRLVTLIQCAWAASFATSEDYSLLKPIEALIQELSIGVPKNMDGEWLIAAMEGNAHFSEGTARYIMLNYFNSYSKLGLRFFGHVMDNFNYASLVKDRVDYGKHVSYYLNPYLNKHRLRHFPHLPSSLREAVEHIPDFERHSIGEFLWPLLSDHSINHRRIKDFRMVVTCDPIFLKVALLCFCLGAARLMTNFRPLTFEHLMVIEEVRREYPEQMSPFIADLHESGREYLKILDSGQPPQISFWMERVELLNAQTAKAHIRSEYFDYVDPLLRGLIHYLFMHHPAWMEEHLLDLSGDARVAYSMTHPEMTATALPPSVPAFELIIPKKPSPGLVPFYQQLIAKYGGCLEEAVRECRAMSAATWVRKGDAKHLLQMLRVSELKDLTFNKLMTTLYYIFKEEYIIWLLDMIFNKDPTTWACRV